MALTVANPTAGTLVIIGAVVIGTIVDGVFVQYSGGGGGGATIPATTNLIKGDGAGNGADSGLADSIVMRTSGGEISSGSLVKSIGTMEFVAADPVTDYATPSQGAKADSALQPNSAADGTYTVITSITILNGQVTAITGS